jgi:hypothetical protein
MTRLSERLKLAFDESSIGEVTRRAEAAGHRFNRPNFYKALRGDHARRPHDSTLREWADGLGLDVRELRQLVDLPEGDYGIYTGPDESARLNRDQRRALDRLIKTIVSPPPTRRRVELDPERLEVDDKPKSRRNAKPRR